MGGIGFVLATFVALGIWGWQFPLPDIRYLLGAIALMFFVGLPFVLIIMATGASKPAATPNQAVLSLDLRQSLSDQDNQSPLAAFNGGGLSVMSITQTLRHAQSDSKVKALFVRLPDGGMAPASADELRMAFKAFRKSGRKIYSYSQGLYPSGIVTSTYMLAAATDEVWMQPGAPFQVTGFSIEDIFFKRAFDKYGVKAEYEQRYEYKNAVNPYLYSDYTAAHKQSNLSWMGSVYTSALRTAAADRQVDAGALREQIEAGPYSAKEALDRRLIDRLGHLHEAQKMALKAAGKDAKFEEFDDYRAAAQRPIVAAADEQHAAARGGVCRHAKPAALVLSSRLCEPGHRDVLSSRQPFPVHPPAPHAPR